MKKFFTSKDFPYLLTFLVIFLFYQIFFPSFESTFSFSLPFLMASVMLLHGEHVDKKSNRYSFLMFLKKIQTNINELSFKNVYVKRHLLSFVFMTLITFLVQDWRLLNFFFGVLSFEILLKFLSRS